MDAEDIKKVLEFGDLQDDKKMQQKLLNFHGSIDKIENLLEAALSSDCYDKLNTEDKVNYNLFLGYTLNTLFWLYLRSRGIDPNNSEVKNQLYRIRQYMVKAKEAHDRNTKRPRIKQDVAKRFVKHGIQYSEKNKDEPSAKKQKISF